MNDKEYKTAIATMNDTMLIYEAGYFMQGKQSEIVLKELEDRLYELNDQLRKAKVIIDELTAENAKLRGFSFYHI